MKLLDKISGKAVEEKIGEYSEVYWGSSTRLYTKN